MNKVMVTGAGGFIGKHVVALLASRGYEVIAITSGAGSGELRSKSAIQWYKADLLDEREMDALFEMIPPVSLIHLAWDATPGSYLTSLNNFKWVRSSLYLLEKFHQSGGRRVLMAGSCAEYEWGPDPCSEYSTPLNYEYPYRACKNTLQLLMTAYSQQVGLSSAWARIFYPFGPYEHPRKLVPHVILSLLKGEKALCSHGRQIRDYIDVRDVADALVHLLSSEVQGSVNIASGKPVVLADLIWKIADSIGRRDLIQLNADAAAQNDPPVVAADVRRLIQEVSWKPQYTTDESIRQSIDWWRLFLKEDDDGSQ